MTGRRSRSARAALVALAIATPFGCWSRAGEGASLRKDSSRPLCAIYRFDPGVGALKGMAPAAVAERLHSWGVGAVFGRLDAPMREALRSRGVRAFAALGCFQGEKHWRSNPESRPIDAGGRPVEKKAWYAGVCPSQEWLIEELEREAARLARSYDGVWLDFMRYPGYWESAEPDIAETCFCPACLARFAGFSGLAYPASRATATEKANWILGRHREEWTRFKVETIKLAAARIAAAARKANPDALVGLFVVPWEREARRAAFGQDLASLPSDIAVVSPMAYHAMLGRPAAWVAETARAVRAEAARPVWPAVAQPERRRAEGALRFSQALTSALAEPSEGVIALSWPLTGQLENLREACSRP